MDDNNMLNFKPIISPLDKTIEKLKSIKRPPDMSKDPDRQQASDRFWKSIMADIDEYDKHIHQKTPFQKTCYGKCPKHCVKIFDKAFWVYSVTGHRKRNFISIYKFPTKLTSVLLVFVAGLLKIIRANQDGKASFYGNIINAVNQAIIFTILWLEKDYVMSIPKIAGFLVAIVILYGICSNAGDSGIGL